jgi:methylase of polypeptide subunit release factors
MLTPTHERLLEQYVDKVAANVPFLPLNDKHLALAEHIDQAEANALLATGIPLDVIGWFSLTAQHWPQELARRDILEKVQAQYPNGFVRLLDT